MRAFARAGQCVNETPACVSDKTTIGLKKGCVVFVYFVLVNGILSLPTTYFGEKFIHNNKEILETKLSLQKMRKELQSMNKEKDEHIAKLAASYESRLLN